MKAFADWPELMAPEDVIECLGLAKNRVYDWFGLPDFPLVDGQKKLQAHRQVRAAPVAESRC